MNYEIIASRLFAKELKRLGKKYKSLKNDYGLLLDRLELNPYEAWTWTTQSQNGNIRKE